MEPFVRLLRAKGLMIVLAVPVFAVLILDSAERVGPVSGVILFVLASLYLAMALLEFPNSIFSLAKRWAGRGFVVRGVFLGMASMLLALAASAFWDGEGMLWLEVAAIAIFLIAYLAAITVALFPPKSAELT